MWNNSPLENPGMDNRERSRYGRTEERSDPSGRGYMAPGVCNERGTGGQNGGTRGCSFMESPTSVFNASYPGGMSRQDGRQYHNPNIPHVHNLYPNNPARQNYPPSGASSPQMGFQDYSGWNSRPDVEMPNFPDRGFVIGPQNSRPQFGNIGPGVCPETGPPRGIYPLRPYSNAGPPRPMLPPMGDPYAPRPAFPPSGFPSNLPPASQPQYPGQPGHISPKPPRPGFPDQPRYY